MKILLVNKFHFLKGGSETYYFELGNMLKKYGHEVAYFSTKNEKNVKKKDNEYFVKEFDGNSKNIFKAINTIYSKQNKKRMLEALEKFKPDIVHINLFQRHLTYSIIEACKEKKVPIVYTAHDLQSVCPASAMLCNGKICSNCLNSSKYNCYKNKCIKNSRLKSLLCSIEGTIYKKKRIYDMFDTIICPSNFVKKMFENDGIKAKFVIMHNFVDIDLFKKYKKNDDDYVLFFGRLSIEKGIMNLLNAFSNQPYGKLFIAGDGPEKNNIIKYINDNNLNDRIKILGFLSHDQIKEFISKSSFVVVPSICYENCPLSVLETLAIGKPVIGSNIGGISELITNGVNGFLFKYDDIEELTMKIKELFENKELRKKMGDNSFKIAKEKYDIKQYYNKLLKIYTKLVGDKNVG